MKEQGMLLLILVLAFSFASFLGSSSRKKDPKPFLGVRGAMMISQQNHSMYSCQEVILQHLAFNGMESVVIGANVMVRLLETGLFPEELISLNLDFAAVGHVFSKTRILNRKQRIRWGKKQHRISMGYTHTIHVNFYGPEGILFPCYKSQTESEDRLTAFTLFAKEIARHISKNMAFRK